MKTNRERGNALIYVLIAIALFAALSMTLGRQGGNSETSDLSDTKAELYATQMISYAAQAKSAVDQMTFSGAKIDDLDFTLPNTAAFEAGTSSDKQKRVYHPDGGGLTAGKLPEEAIAWAGTDPVAGWYMGRFNNIDWTKTAGNEVILAAYGIKQKVCEKINNKIIGKTTVPELSSVSAKEVFVDKSFVSGGSNADLTTDPDAGPPPACADCYKRSSLCIHDNGSQIYVFYTVLEDQ